MPQKEETGNKSSMLSLFNKDIYRRHRGLWAATNQTPNNMKRRLLFFALLLAALPLRSQYDFSAVAPSGQTLYYNINPGTQTVTVVTPILTWDRQEWGEFEKPLGTLNIPSTVLHGGAAYTVTAIGNRAFYTCNGITAVTLPNGLLSIGETAFYGLPIEHIALPSTLTTIGSEAFKYCTNLRSVDIPNSVTSIGVGAFENCYSLEHASLPSFIDRIANNLFQSCRVLRSIVIPNTVEEIGESVFDGCGQLRRVIWGANITVIGRFAFRYTAITQLTIPERVTSIGDHAFAECHALQSINLNNRLTAIDAYTFYKCTSLRSISIPGNIENIGMYAFGGCANLSSVNFSEGLRIIGTRAFCSMERLQDAASWKV